MTNFHKLLAYLLLALAAGCVDPYRPPEIAAPNTYLVVDGFLNTAAGETTTFKLSRTQNLTDSKSPTLVTKATVTIESDRNAKYTLKEGTSGVYSVSGIQPQTGEKFRLRIKTATSEYLSDMVPVKPTPAIDSVTWKVDGAGVRISVNTHDRTNNTRYYRWEYDETWEFNSAFFSSYEVKNKQVVLRQEDIFRCWTGAKSRSILIGSSAKLSQDVISQNPLLFIEGYSVKIGLKYSILVKQYALTPEAHQYWEQLSKTTESIGSLFDPQPTQVTGNIQCLTNPNEPVLGFFSAGTISTKRLFIRRIELPYWRTITAYDDCVIADTLSTKELIDNKYPNQIPLKEVDMMPGMYETGDSQCVDCRLRGTNVKPAFWDN